MNHLHERIIGLILTNIHWTPVNPIYFLLLHLDAHVQKNQ